MQLCASLQEKIAENLVINTISFTVVGCHVGQFCNDTSLNISAGSATECCELGGRSFNSNNESDCISACAIIGKLISGTVVYITP